ncbi:hypothetical protein LPJ61_001972 [Coemansia biformis]|uniref:Uncharacterized protein n=1 Tax=Coemansia biformis TaxID=1286918 RepID=A0A9W7Y949_9FUNG|nr:hypothetical protein LPJ61_001972 [Coemansia biformis]
MMASKTEESILRSRLVAEDRALRRCLRQLSTMCARHARLSPEETQEACTRVLQEVRWFRHTVQVAAQSQRRCTQEVRLYTEQQAALEARITDAHAEIERLGSRLEDSRNHKRHKIAYDEIAAEANKRPARKRLADETDKINSEIEQLRQEEASHDAVARSLQTQYAVVIGELSKLADMSKNALNMQDLGIYLGDSDVHAEKAGPDHGHLHASSGISPATPRQAGDPRDAFATPIDGPPLEDPREAHAGASMHGESSEGEEGEESEDDVGVSLSAAAAEEEGEEGECEHDREDEEGELLG